MAKDKKPKKEDDETEGAEGAEGEDGEEGEGGGKKKLPLKLMLMIGVPVLVLAIGGGAAAFFLMKPKADAHAEKGKDKKDKKHDKKKEEKGKEKEKEKGKDEKGGPVIKEGPDGVMYYTLPDILVNIQSNDGRPTYLKLKLTLEAPSQETIDVMEPMMPRITDLFTSFLRELRTDDLTGSEGSMRLRLELLRRVNLALAPQAKINAVLIEELLVQ
jgi:flagellar FliL protein